MPTDLNLNELLRLADIHTSYEFSHDLDALMKTVHPTPCWIYEPFGCEIVTPDAVAQMYQRMFPVIAAIKEIPLVNMWFSDDGFIGEVHLASTMPDGSQLSISQFSWCEFTGDLISGECNYIDADSIGPFTQVLGESFFTFPGVSVTSLE